MIRPSNSDDAEPSEPVDDAPLDDAPLDDAPVEGSAGAGSTGCTVALILAVAGLALALICCCGGVWAHFGPVN